MSYLQMQREIRQQINARQSDLRACAIRRAWPLWEPGAEPDSKDREYLVRIDGQIAGLTLALAIVNSYEPVPSGGKHKAVVMSR